jgi:hypothetical protein
MATRAELSRPSFIILKNTNDHHLFQAETLEKVIKERNACVSMQLIYI